MTRKGKRINPKVQIRKVDGRIRIRNCKREIMETRILCQEEVLWSKEFYGNKNYWKDLPKIIFQEKISCIILEEFS